MLDLVLLPGMDGTGLLFSKFVSALGTTVNPVVLRYPEDRSLDYAQLQEYVQRQLPRNRPYAILGESFSGPIAIALAANNTQSVKALILACSFARNPQPMLAGLMPFVTWLPDIRTSTLASWALFGSHSTPALRTRFNQVLNTIPLPVLHARLQAICEVDVTSKLRQTRLPILYLRAMRDRVVPASASRHIKSTAPQTQIMAIDGPHMLLQTQPELTATAVLRFLEETPLT